MDYVLEFVRFQLDTNSTPHTEWKKKDYEARKKAFYEFVTLLQNPELDRNENALNLAKLRKWKKKQGKKERNYYFITIAPADDSTFKENLKAVQSLLRWTCWSNVIAVAEQRSSNEEFYGFHFHILAKKATKYAPSNVKQRLSRLEKKFPGPATDIQIIDENFAKDKQDYFFEKWGKTKKGEKKATVMKMDEIWRKKHGLPRFFGEKFNL